MQNISFVVLLFFFFSIQASPRHREFCAKNEESVSSGNTLHSIKPYDFKVVARFPHDQHAFTQGLVYYRGNLYESTGILGHSTVKKIEMTTGAVSQESGIADIFFGEGLFVYNQQLIQMSWKTGKMFYFDPLDLKRLKTRFWDKEVWGATVINNQWVISDGSSRLFFVDPESLTVERKIKITLDKQEIFGINELEYVAGYIYANVWPTSCIVKIDPIQGNIVGWLDLVALVPNSDHYHLADGSVLNGIAYQQQTEHFIVTGKYWPFYFVIKLVSDEK